MIYDPKCDCGCGVSVSPDESWYDEELDEYFATEEHAISHKSALGDAYDDMMREQERDYANGRGV